MHITKHLHEQSRAQIYPLQRGRPRYLLNPTRDLRVEPHEKDEEDEAEEEEAEQEVQEGCEDEGEQEEQEEEEIDEALFHPSTL